MKRVLVLVPFHLSDTDTDHVPGETITVSEDALARIQSININMVQVLVGAETNEGTETKKTRTSKPKTSK